MPLGDGAKAPDCRALGDGANSGTAVAKDAKLAVEAYADGAGLTAGASSLRQRLLQMGAALGCSQHTCAASSTETR